MIAEAVLGMFGLAALGSWDCSPSPCWIRKGVSHDATPAPRPRDLACVDVSAMRAPMARPDSDAAGSVPPLPRPSMVSAPHAARAPPPGVHTIR
jgi:hypothetical protein